MKVSYGRQYGMPGIAYSNFMRSGPVVERFNEGARFGIMEVDVDGFGFIGGVFNTATTKRLNRLRRRRSSVQSKLKSAKGLRAAVLKRRLKVLNREIRQLLDKAKKQIKRRKAKGKKLPKRLKRLSLASREIRKQRRGIFQGKTSAVPKWFMRGASQKDRIARWSSMTAKARKRAFERFKKRRQGRKQGRQMVATMQDEIESPTGFGPDSTFDNQFEQNGIPSDLPSLVESSDDSDFDSEEDFSEDLESIEEEGAANKLFLYGGLAVAGIAAVYFLNKKKKPTNGKRSRSSRAR